MNLASTLAQGTPELSASSSPMMILVGLLVSAVGTLLTWVLKELSSKLAAINLSIRESMKESHLATKELMRSMALLAHRQKGLEGAIQADVLTRPGIPAFLREQLEEKLKKRQNGDDTRDEPA